MTVAAWVALFIVVAIGWLPRAVHVLSILLWGLVLAVVLGIGLMRVLLLSLWGLILVSCCCKGIGTRGVLQGGRQCRAMPALTRRHVRSRWQWHIDPLGSKSFSVASIAHQANRQCHATDSCPASRYADTRTLPLS